MEPLDPLEAREAEFTKFTRSQEDLSALREHVKQIVSGAAFKGSQRSGQFLRYIVDQSIAGRFDQLKERQIGIELFGRTPSYDTGEDAIVRVTASDVRRRLLQHYGSSGKTATLRLSLPQGSYIPELVRLSNEPVAESAERDSSHAAPESQAVEIPREPWLKRWRSGWRLVMVVAVAALAVGGGIGWLAGGGRLAHGVMPQSAQTAPQPWLSLLTPSHPVHLITSDPNIVVVQELTGTQLSLSDYANHRYFPEEKLTPEQIRYCRSILWGDNSAAAVDPPIAVRIAELAALHGARTEARAARSVQFSDLKTDDSLIFLGSPRSNPWTAMLSDLLDYRFVFDPSTKQEILVDAHPKGSEPNRLVPTAMGWATGQSFAVVAFLQNPDSHGQILLLAGANGEGTEAAGEFVTDLPRLSSALQNCGVQSRRAATHFEIVLRLNTMAGSPSHVDVAACHLLGGDAQR